MQAIPARVIQLPLARNHGDFQESAPQLNERNQLNERFFSTKTPGPCFLHRMLPKMSETYTDIEARIQAACLKLSELEKPNIAAIAPEYSIPDQRSRARAAGRPSRSQGVVGNKRLSEAEELAVCLYLKRLDSIGTAARIPMLTGCANAILKWNYQPTTESPNTPPPTVGPAWAPQFLEYYPEFHIHKQRSLDYKRRKAHNSEVLLNWFQHYKSICEEKRIVSSDIYNFNEKGFHIRTGKNQGIITLDPDSIFYLASSSNRELITACETISGDGEVLPPMLILTGALHLNDWYTKTHSMAISILVYRRLGIQMTVYLYIGFISFTSFPLGDRWELTGFCYWMDMVRTVRRSLLTVVMRTKLFHSAFLLTARTCFSH